MNLRLLIPCLFWPDPTFKAVYNELPLPSLELLLTKSTRLDDTPQDLEPWLCKSFGVVQHQDWPIAPLTLAIDGNGQVEAGDDYWLRADPVHLHIERDQILLADSRVFNISAEEADQLAVSLNHHFGVSGNQISFLPLQPDRWYIRVIGMTPPKTHLLSEAANKSIKPLLPHGAHQGIWRSLFNEIQMVLHEHPVNQAREGRGEPVINCTWFWGGGVTPKSIVSPYTSVWSNELLSRSLTMAAGTAHVKLPLDAKALALYRKPGEHLIVLDVLQGKAQYQDVYGWRESLKYLEQNWFQPLIAMLRQGQLTQVVITAIGGAKTVNFTARNGDLRKFWRRPKPFSWFGASAN